MIPILYESTETAFTSNGIGRLSDAISCVVTQEGTGSGWPLELEMVYPVSGIHFSDIIEGRIIAAIPEEDAGIQPFDIVQITRPIDGKATIYAQHISYRLSRIVTTGGQAVPASASACATALEQLKTNAILPTGMTFPFTFTTDVVAVAGYSQDVPASVRSRLVGSEGSIIDQFGGEYKWDKWTVSFLQERGSDNHVTIRYGKNLTDIEQDKNLQNTISGVVPFWKKDSALVVGAIAYASNHTSFPQERIVAVDFSQDFETQPTLEQLAAAGQIYANAHSKPDISIRVSFVALWQTEEYADIAPLEKVHLCDYVTVQFPDLGVDEKAKIVKTEYNVLLERYNSITIGDLKQTLTEVVTDGISGQIEILQQEVMNAASWLTSANGYVCAIKDTDGTWKEIVISSEQNPYSSTAKILRINNYGIGFTAGGLDSTNYRNAWTIDGHLTLGGANNEMGWLTLLDSVGDTMATMNYTGLHMTSKSSGGVIQPTIDITYGNYTAKLAPDVLSILKNNSVVASLGEYAKFSTIDAVAASIGTLHGDAVEDLAVVAKMEIRNDVILADGTFDAATYSQDAKLSRMYSAYTYDNSLSGTTRAVRINSNGLFGYTSSSRKIKQDISEELGRDRDPHGLYDIPVVEFHYKADPDGPLHIGFIAEDMEECFPVAACLDGSGQPCGWDADSVLAGVVRLIQEQKKLIDTLEKRIEALEEKINADTVF